MSEPIKMEDLPETINETSDFVQYCNCIKYLASKNDRNTLGVKIENYIRKRIVNLVDEGDKEANKPKLLEWLLTVLKELPLPHYLMDYGQDLFALLFKVTYYDDKIEYSVSN